MKILWFIYPFCSIFIFIGLGIAFWTMRGMLEARSVSDWPKTNAKLLSCEFQSDNSSDGESYEVIVSYEYTVHGQKYESNQIHPAYSASSFEGHRPLFERLDEASVVKVHYNEVDPSESYIIGGSFSSHLAAFFGGMIFMSAGIFFLLTFHFAVAGNSDYASALEIVK